jgi:6-phosphofructokinase 1
LITKRHEEGKSFGTILIPDGLLAHLPHYAHLIEELNSVYSNCKSYEEIEELEHKLIHAEKVEEGILSPWSDSLYNVLPEFTKKQLCLTRRITGKIELAQVQTEKLISYFVEVELKRRKQETGKKVPFSPVTHFFGYQGRGSLPSLFDCSLASTYGYTAGVLIQNNLTGVCTTARGLTSPASEWKVGAVPLIAMMDIKTRSSVYGKDQVYIQSGEVDLSNLVFQKAKVSSKAWEMYDNFINPGPIQYFGEGKDTINRTTYLKNKQYSEQVNVVKDLCNLIQRKCTFADESGILRAAIASLKGVHETL